MNSMSATVVLFWFTISITGDPVTLCDVDLYFNKPDTSFDANKRIKKITQIGMGDAGLGRGNCFQQIRISARGGQPEPCRQHELRKSIGDNIIPKK